jgi:branched-chain amino acid transport system permease protein
MTDLLHLLLKGLSLGCLYALGAMGFVIIFKPNKIVNLAHGQLMGLGAFILILFSSMPGIPVSTALMLSVFISLVLAFVFERLFIHRLAAGTITQGIFATLGIILICKGVITFISMGGVLKDRIEPAGEISRGLGVPGISSLDAGILISGILLILFFLLFFKHSAWGLYLRAVSDNRKASLSMGIPIERLSTLSWVIGGAAAGLSGILLTIDSGLRLHDIGAMESMIFPVVIMGGLGSMRGAILGGLIMGLIESIERGHPSSSSGEILPYLILLLVLVIKPYGLFSDKGDMAGIGR